MKRIWLLVTLLAAGCAQAPLEEAARAAAAIEAGTPPEQALFDAGLDRAELLRLTRSLVTDRDLRTRFLDELRRESAARLPQGDTSR